MCGVISGVVCFRQHEEEPPQDMRPGASGEKSLSKSALKNQKKREAKKAARQVSGRQPVRRLHLSSQFQF